MSNFYKLEMSTTAPKTLDMYIYSDVEADGYDYWRGEVIKSETSSEFFRQSLEEAGDIAQINIYINSLGGSVMEGVAIYNQLRRHKAHKTVYIDGFACSVASVIAMAGDEVIMPSNTMMMIHAPLTYVVGHASDLRKAADELDRISESTKQAYLQKAKGKLTSEKLEEMYNAETYWSAAECIELGLADRMAEADIDIDAAIKALTKTDEKDIKQITAEKIRNALKQKADAWKKPAEQVKEEAVIPAVSFNEIAEQKINQFFNQKGGK